MHNDVKKILISEEEIIKRCSELGEELTKEYDGKNPLVIGLLKGSVPFIGDLVKYVDCELELDYMDVSSYHGAVSTGEVKIIKDLDTSVKNRHVLIVEDIIDTGLTLSKVKELFSMREAASIKIVSLLDKKEGRKVDIKGEYIGFDIPNEFVIGYGLDYNEKYRNLPYVGILKEEVYSK